MDPTDLTGWLFLKDKDDGKRHLASKTLDIWLRSGQCYEHGMLSILRNKYIGKVIDAYKQMIGPANNIVSHLDKPHHMEAGTSELLDAEGLGRYQSLIGSPQSAVSLGRMDISTVVMAMSSFRAVSRQGHRLRKNENDFSPYGISYHDRMGTVYGDCMSRVVITPVHYVDASLIHNSVSGALVTGCTHLLNQTSETATYGSVFVATMNRTGQTLDAIGTLLRYPTVPIGDQSHVTGNNRVVKISAPPEAKSLHRVQKAIAASMAINHSQ